MPVGNFFARYPRGALTAGIVIVSLLGTLTLNRSHFRIFVERNDRIMSLDPGISSYPGKRIVRQLPSILWFKLFGSSSRPHIQRLDFDIKQPDLNVILSDRDRALNGTGKPILTDPTEVPAEIRYRGMRVKAKIRLKGDFGGHWRNSLRMSLRVSVEGNQAVCGFTDFSICKPGDRQFPFDDLYTSTLRQMGQLAPRETYVQVYVNGTSWGVMCIEEHMAKHFLENQQRKDSLIFKFSNDQDLLYISTTRPKSQIVWAYRLNDQKLTNKVFNAKRHLKNPLTRKRYSYVARERLQASAPHLYDMDTYTRS